MPRERERQMRKLLLALIIVLGLTSCRSVPEHVKKADSLAIQAQVDHVGNMDELLTQVLKSYVAEVNKNIEFRAKVALQTGKTQAEVDAFKKTNTEKLRTIVERVVKVHKLSKRGWVSSLEVRLKISEYLENKVGAKDIIDTIIKELNDESGL
jgi:hypothetical protein